MEEKAAKRKQIDKETKQKARKAAAVAEEAEASKKAAE